MAESLKIPELNKIMVIGRITKDLELRYTSSNQAVVTFNIACSRNYKDSQTGDWKEIVSFIPVVVWGKRAEIAADKLKKGSAIYVEGRLQSRNWETKQGEKRNILELIADNIQFLNKQEKTDVNNTSVSKEETWDVEEINLKVSNISEEEIPF